MYVAPKQAGAHRMRPVSRRFLGIVLALALGAATLVVSTGAGTSPAGAEEVEIIQDVTCQGANQQTTTLLGIYFSDTGGILELETPMTVDAPDELLFGTTGDVTISSQASIPPDMAEVQENLGVTTTLLSSNVNVQVAGGAEVLWEGELPPLPPPGETIEVTNTEQVTPTAFEPITYTLQSPFDLSIQIAGGIFPNPIVMVLTCSFSQTLLATTTVTVPEGWALPGAPTGVTALGAAGMANVSWTPPAGETTPPITGYFVTAHPGDQTVETSGDVTSVDMIGLEPGEYTFTVVSQNVMGDSDPSEPSNEVTVGGYVVHFDDLGPSDPFYEEIQWMASVGLSTGFGDGTWKPGATLTRQAMSAFIYRLNGSPDGPDPECEAAPFNDVAADHPFCGEIAWMKETGISTGYDDGTRYQPNLGLTRQAMSAFLYRSANPGSEPLLCLVAPFSDVPTTHPFCPEIAWMKETGISTGYEGNLYLPENALTRQALAAFIYRYTLVVPTDLS